MTEIWIHPSLVLLLGAALLPLFPARFRPLWLVLVPAATLALVLGLTPGEHGKVAFLEWGLVFGRVDGLSQVFAIIMALMCLIGSVYALQVEDKGQHVAAWVYVAGSLGVIHAGDFLVLFLFWELMAISSVFLIWARREPASLQAGFRYLLVHMLGGLALLAGIILHGQATGGDFTFGSLTGLSQAPAVWLILIGILLNAACPPLHAWLPDAYPRATFSGSVFLSAFTTKTAVYALCRGFVGMEILIVLGVGMALYGVVYAFLSNDARRLLSYHIVSQVGFMVAGVGIGTEMAVNGAIAHAFAHILYKGLLFMGCGSVLLMTGKSRFTDLGGLYRKTPWTMLFTLVGALSISAVPLFSGFVSKSMTIAAGFEAHHYWAAFLLMLASIGTFLSINLKLIHLIWFGPRRMDSESYARASDPSWNMMTAMGVTAALCFLIGVFPHLLYGLLPHPVDFQPYTAYHLSETCQLLLFAALGYFLLRGKMEPKALVSLDLDRVYGRAGRVFAWMGRVPAQALDRWWGGCHEAGGIGPLMRSSSGVSVFDQKVIDGLVDGTAHTIRNLGGRLRVVQRGSLQQNLTMAFAAVALALLLTLLFT